ncbi:hypothetical protein QUF80_20140 [Desulfococcaceae bacterium HSG8]|nr:hypothetical protein [Desulfococcaceae bacterium HSG8]
MSLGQRQWIISRSLCFYQVFVLGDIPRAERGNALDTRIRQWSPFTETGRYIVWHDDTAQVWIWDETARRDAAKSADANVPRVFPETILRARAKDDMVRIISCTEGIEAQVWRDHILIGSHWWADELPAKEWKRFLLSHDLDPMIEPPDAEKMPWLNRAWGKTADDGAFLSLRHERLWVSAVMGILIFFLIWQGVSAWRWHQAREVSEERIGLLTREAEPILEARNQAMAYRQNAERLLSIDALPGQLEIMAAVAEKLPLNQVVLTEWHYNQGRLTFTLQGKQRPDPRYYVEIYQAHPFFKDVSAEQGGRVNQLVVSCQL